MKRRRCPGSTAGTVLNRDRWRCRVRKQTSPSSQRQAPHPSVHGAPHPHPPSITPSLPPPPAPRNPFACNLSQAERGFSSFVFFSFLFRALKMPFTSVVSCCICGEWTSGGARAETRASSGRLSGWRAVWDALRSNAAVPLRLQRARQAFTRTRF